MTARMAAEAPVAGGGTSVGTNLSTGVKRAGLLALVILVALVGVRVLSKPRLDNDIELRSDGVEFSDDRLDSAAGLIDVALVNGDAVWHTFTVAELDVDLRVAAGEQGSVRFDAPEGTYAFVCTIPGHERAGMTGVLTVH